MKLKRFISHIAAVSVLFGTITTSVNVAKANTYTNLDFNGGSIAPFKAIVSDELGYWTSDLPQDMDSVTNSAIRFWEGFAESARNHGGAMMLYGDNNNTLNYLNLEQAASKRVILSYDMALGFRRNVSLGEHSIQLVLGEDNTISDNNDAISFDGKGIALSVSTTTDGHAWIDGAGNVAPEPDKEFALSDGKQSTPNMALPKNVNLSFASNEVLAGDALTNNPVAKNSAEKWYHIDVDIDMDNSVINSYVDGDKIGATRIPAGMLEQLGHIQFRLNGDRNWHAFEAYIDNFSISDAGSDIAVSAVLNNDRIGAVITTGGAMLNAGAVTADEIKVIKCSDNSVVNISNIEVSDSKTISINFTDALPYAAEYKVILDDSIKFIGGGKAQLASFVTPQNPDAVLNETVFEDNFDYVIWPGDDAGIANQRKMLTEHGWDGNAGDLMNTPMCNFYNKQISEGDMAIWMFKGDAVGYSPVLKKMLNETGTSGIYRIRFKAQYENTGETANILAVKAIVNGTEHLLFNYGLQANAADFGPRMFPGDSGIFNDGKTDWFVDNQHKEMNLAPFTDWRTYEIELDLSNGTMNVYIDNQKLPEMNRTLNKDIFNSLDGILFDTWKDNPQMNVAFNDFSIVKTQTQPSVKSVRFIDADGSKVLPADKAPAGCKGMVISFYGNPDLEVNDSRITIEGTDYSGRFDASEGGYVITFNSPLPVNGTYKLTIADTAVSGGYVQNFSTDTGRFQVSQPAIALNGSGITVGNAVTVTTKAVNTTESSKNVLLSVGFYRTVDGAAELLNMSYENETVDGTKDLSINAEIPDGTEYIKAFVWDDFDNIEPLTGYTEIR